MKCSFLLGKRFPEARVLRQVGNGLLDGRLLWQFKDVVPALLLGVFHHGGVGKSAVGTDALDDIFRRQQGFDFFDKRKEIFHAVGVARIQLQVDEFACAGHESDTHLVQLETYL